MHAKTTKLCTEAKDSSHFDDANEGKTLVTIDLVRCKSLIFQSVGLPCLCHVVSRMHAQFLRGTLSRPIFSELPKYRSYRYPQYLHSEIHFFLFA